MKIIFDIDGTLTDYNNFVKKNAIKYFKNKYKMEIVNPNALEIEDIFDMQNFFINKKNMTQEEALKEVKRVMDKYWISTKFIKFSLLGKFRKNVSKTINKMISEGNDIEIYSSRAKTCDHNFVGFIARNFTFLQLKLNGLRIRRKKVNFFKNDEEKTNAILQAHPDLVFDDKPEIIEKISNNNIKVICVNGLHNQEVPEEAKKVQRIESFDYETIQKTEEKLFGKIKLKCYNRAAKSDLYFKKLKLCKKPILSFLNPIVLHEENLIDRPNDPVIYAPNHRSTLDPLVITSVVFKNIHWAALLRFFKGEDSIFNNSKNPILCKITSKLFKSLEYFPIDRKSDNPKANNIDSLKDMTNFLSCNQAIGIFGEGTTRRPEGHDFGTFSDSFIILAEKNDAWIQPITSLWLKELDLNYKMIINIGKPFKVEKGKSKEAMEYFLNIQKEMLEENKQIKEDLLKAKIIKKALK